MIKEYRSLKRRREAREARTSKLEVESTHTHVLEATDTIRELIGTLKQRQLSASVIEAEIIDEEPVKQEEIEA